MPPMGACASSEEHNVSLGDITLTNVTDVEQRKSISERDSLMDIRHDDDLEHEEKTAIRKIQKSMRRTKALDKANAENHWRFFAQVDTLEENETLHLADFMRNLVELVPGAKETNEKNEAHHSSAHPPSIVLDDIILEDDDKDKMNCEASKVSADIQAIKSNPRSEFMGFRGPITPDLPNALMELFRPPAIGRYDLKNLTKLLRNVYKTLKDSPNINKITVPENANITVVGDIHGQIDDLLLILDETGPPSATNLILFNGDFVDRGRHGFEVVTLMFSYLAAYPEYVFMNRGNHEDPFVCCNYGFQEEVISKYDQLTFMLFAEIFKYLPLFSLINESVFVVHGGLFHNINTTLQDLSEIDRTNYEAVPRSRYPDCIEGMDPESSEARAEYLKQLQRDALWSDPRPNFGTFPNQRGAGVTFGPDVTREFMEKNDLKMIIRSHECCRHGTDFPFDTTGEMAHYYQDDEADVGRNSINPFHTTSLPISSNDPLLVTLFSASNYLDGDNEGAYLILTAKKEIPKYANEVVGADMYFTCHRYKTSSKKKVENKPSHNVTTHVTAMDLLLRKKRALQMAFARIDVESTSMVTRAQWAQILQETTGLKILWHALIDSLVPSDARSDDGIYYVKFIDSLRRSEHRDNDRAIYKHQTHSSHHIQKKNAVSTPTQIMDALYGNKKRVLEKIYYYFDTDGDGLISSKEFHDGCTRLNELGKLNAAKEQARLLASGEEANVIPYVLKDVDEILDVMDFNHSGSIDINEFFESFRLVSLHSEL